jgi:uroporphyrin-III C-methyltransferase
MHNGDIPDESKEDAQKRRMRWVAQISEYWPLEHLAKLDATQSERILRRSYQNGVLSHNMEAMPQSTSIDSQTENLANPSYNPASQHELSLKPIKPPGQIYLLGSGPGHPDLLTVAAYNILTQKATWVLSDKLVPSEVLALIPPTTTVKIAKKFPGNNEGAQNELMVEAVDAASKGEVVARVSRSAQTCTCTR